MYRGNNIIGNSIQEVEKEFTTLLGKARLGPMIVTELAKNYMLKNEALRQEWIIITGQWINDCERKEIPQTIIDEVIRMNQILK